MGIFSVQSPELVWTIPATVRHVECMNIFGVLLQTLHDASYRGRIRDAATKTEAPRHEGLF
eukprot:scaffold1048_cov90-Amphora_coffeaeformis.AAC.5